MDHKKGKWAEQIITSQNEDGTWGLQFHTLSVPTKKYPLTTEQALRRLMVLGYNINDAPIRKTVDYMTACLRGERKMDDSWEKTHNWPLFAKMMLSAWTKIFEPDNDLAISFALRWANVIEKTFKNGKFDYTEYVDAYTSQFASKPKGGREIDFSSFYQISLLQGLLTPKTESLMIDYILSKSNGIYYVSSGPLNIPPEVFASRNTSWYLTALEMLSDYEIGKLKLKFAVDWLHRNKDENGQWDLGAKANDKVYFPYSDSWRNIEDRKKDCTERISVLLRKIDR
jgi:hypothetical protein